MERKQKIIIGIFIAVFLLLVILIFLLLFMNGPDKGQPVAVVDVVAEGTAPDSLGGSGLLDTTPVANPGTVVVDVEEEVPAPEPIKPDVGAELRRLASSITERYGSFSNQTDFVNIEDLQSVMTSGMQSSANAMVAESRAKGLDSTVYFGITTRALSATIDSLDEDGGFATVTVTAQRNQRSGSVGGDELYYQKAVLDMVRQGELWKVNEIQWLPKEDQ